MMNEPERKVGVYICQCGINIGAAVDVEAVRDHAETRPGSGGFLFAAYA
jgi:heterodisulfide reductase subunit A-like polyferredoxin